MELPVPTTLLRVLERFSSGRIFFTLPNGMSPGVALTFDDGPHPETTPRILDALAAASVHATFFVQGNAVAAAPAILRRAHQDGHCIASHGMLHISARKQSAAAALANATECHQLLQHELGTQLPRIYRPPYGELTVGALRSLLNSGFRIAFWNRDSNDSFVSSAAGITQLLTQAPPVDRDILLFHDDYAITAEALPKILSLITAGGVRPVRLD
jgi:peptidoglycan/xylan/chitin deacetylase (PgdA/CDA1 family)